MSVAHRFVRGLFADMVQGHRNVGRAASRRLLRRRVSHVGRVVGWWASPTISPILQDWCPNCARVTVQRIVHVYGCGDQVCTGCRRIIVCGA